MALRAITFDFDGTLADSWRDIAASLNLSLRELGLPQAPPEGIKSWIGEGVRRLVEQALPVEQRDSARIDELLAIYRGHYRAHCLDSTVLFDGVRELLAALNGRPMALLSNKPVSFLVHMARVLGVADGFQHILGGDSLRYNKPHPSVLCEVAQRLGYAPADMWMIGDSEIDVQAGHAAGCPVIACTWGLRDRSVLEAAAPDHLVDAPAEILPFVC
jgi:phosphoglycolate phosphatase